MSNQLSFVAEQSIGEYLSSQNVLGADNDSDVIKAWINYTSSNSQHTFNSYLKEVKRWIVYCDSVGIHYSDATVDHINEYLSLLEYPTDKWLKPLNNNVVRLSTQILIKPLCRNSVEYAQRVLNGFYGYLQNAGIMSRNPVKLSRRIKQTKSFDSVGKSLSFAAWDYLSAWLKHETDRADQPNRSKAIRDRWLMHLLYHSGVRRSSIVGMTMAAFKPVEKAGRKVWIFSFSMKGSKKHEIIVTSELYDEWLYYRKAINLPKEPAFDESHIPLVTAVDRNSKPILRSKSISTRGVNYAIEQSLIQAQVDCEDFHIGEELARTTPHTFRHTSASHRLNLGIDVVATQQHLGHSSINTTMIYLNNIQEHLVTESEKLDRMNKKRMDAKNR